MSGLPPALDEARLAELAGLRNLEEGRDYWLLGRVRERVRWGERLAGRVEGWRDTYRVTLQALPGGLESLCTCGRRQPCRHAVALLLAWGREPGSFADLEALAALWEGASRGELAELFWRFLEAPGQPLEALAGAGAGRAWEARSPGERVAGLEGFLGEQPGEAAARFERLAAALAPRGGEDGELRRQRLETGAELLRRALDLPRALRARLLPQPWAGAAERWLEEAERGGAEGAAAGLRLLARALVEPELPAGLYARFLRAALRLDPRGAVEALLRAAAGEAEAARRLGQEPAGEARERAVLALADLLVLRGRGGEAERALEEASGLPAVGERRVEGRLAEGDLAGAVAAARQALAAAEGAAAVRYWRERLAQLLALSGEEGEALALRTANFAEEADLESYRRLREAALRLGRWPEVAPGARAALRRRAGRAALVQALAEEGEADQLAEELGAALAEKTDLPWEPALRALLWLGRRKPERAAALGEELLRRSGGEAGQRERLRRALRRMRPGRARGPA